MKQLFKALLNVIVLLIISAASVVTAEVVLTSNTPDRLVLVSGATGKQGGAVARELLGSGFRVRALTRNPESDRAQALRSPGMEVVKGDFGDPDSLLRAMNGAWGVFSVQNFWEHGYEGEVQQGKNMVDAAKQSGVRHFVYTSVAHADEGTGIPHFDSKSEIEKYLAASGLPYTILRPVSFMENWEYAREELLAGSINEPFDPDSVRQQISVRDIGRFAALVFSDPGRWIGKSVELAADQYTTRQMIKTFRRVTGRPVRYRQISWQEHEKNAGHEMTVMDRWIDSTGYHVDVAAVRKLLPGMWTLEQYLQEKGWGK